MKKTQFIRYTSDELSAMRSIFAGRRSFIVPAYDAIRVEGKTDTTRIALRRRLGKMKSHCDNGINVVNMILRERGETHSKRKHKIRGRITDPGKWQERYQSLKNIDPDSDLPQTLIGNAVLEELPFELVASKYYDHPRLRVFALKGYVCVHPRCNETAVRLVKTLDASGGVHLDVFTSNLKLMNVDHIIPRSAGGGDEIENLQPMCAYHNSKKSNKSVPY